MLKKQIPTLLALIVLFVGAGAGVLLVGQRTEFLPRAGPEYQPRKIRITNTTDDTFTVSWATDSATVGSLRYGTTPNPSTTVADDRDKLSGESGNFKLHHATVRGLNPSTNYYFKIGSGSGNDLYDNNGQPYQVTTAPAVQGSDSNDTAYGTVVNPTQTPAEGTIVYLSLPGAAPQSALVKSSGSWAVNLGSVRTQTLQALHTTAPGQIISIEAVGSDLQTTTGTTSTDNDQPVPTITLGQAFNFAETVTEVTAQVDTSSEVAPQSATTQTTRTPGFDIDASDATPSASTIELLNPAVDGEQLNTTLPEFLGQAPPNTELTITVHSAQEFEDTIVVGETGEFAWSPPEDLEPGDHTITVSYFDLDGVLQQVKRNFTVYAQGESDLPALVSTPSATPKATTTPTPIATGSTRVSQPSTASGIPVAGVSTPTVLMLTTGFSMITAGLYLSKRMV